MRYVGLLRGINVGGNRKVPMAQLRQVYESLGFFNVITYLNSGNIIFSSKVEPDISRIDNAMKKAFGFDVSTLILPGALITSVANAIPKEWNNDRLKEKTDVVYLFEAANRPEIIQELGYRPEFEELRYVDGAILAHLDRQFQSRSSLLKVIGTPVFRHMTVRNVNTARKLAELVAA